MEHQPSDPESKGSNKSFGLVFAAVFCVIGLWPIFSSEAVRWWSMATAFALAVIAFILPSILEWPNRLWTRFGLLLHRITNPILLGILFALVFIPMALWLRIARRQPISRRSADETTFWHKPAVRNVEPDSFRKLY